MTGAQQRRRDLAVATAALAASSALAGWVSRAAPESDRAAMVRVNRTRGPSWLFRVPQQLGTPWVLPAMALGAAWRRERRLALAAAVALPVEKACEVAIKKTWFRRRPGLEVRTSLRDDAPVFGSSYPSGHTAIGACAVALLAPYARPWGVAGLAAGVVATGYVRVHQGAHYPLDALGGGVLGTGVAALVTAAVGRPPRP